MFELDRHLKQSGLANKAHVPWDGGPANTAGAAALEVIRRLVHEIHVITHEAHKVEGMHLRPPRPRLLRVSTCVCIVASTERRMRNALAECSLVVNASRSCFHSVMDWSDCVSGCLITDQA